MSTKLFVGGLDFSIGEEELRQAFAEIGELVSAVVIMDRMTGRSRGFGFVEYADADTAQRAIDAMNGTMLSGRAINVNVAQERRNDGGFGRGGGGFNRRRY